MATALVLCLTGLGFAQKYGSAISAFYLDAAGSYELRVPLPMIGYRDPGCHTDASKWLDEWHLENLEHFRQAVPLDDEHGFLVLDETCLTFPDVSRGEASAAVATMIADVQALGVADLRPGYGRDQYDWIELNPDPPNVVGISYQAVNPEPGGNPRSFGYLFFEYRPLARTLHLHQHRYFASYAPNWGGATEVP